ncbi:MAG: sugar transferase, partial [Planctomycetes bacterium]|nr:sugar transferase [Planctomycetota bacterium]
MKVWLVKIGESIPHVDGPDVRPMRTAMLAEHLVAAGHDVTWWASAFCHARKTFRARRDEIVTINDSYRVYLMKAHGYRASRSPGRIIDHVALARRFGRLAREQPAPDIIVASMPTPGLARAAVEYGRSRGAALVVDLRDMWPDCYVEQAPPGMRPLVWLAARPADRALRVACSQADAVIGITEPFVRWGLAKAGRSPGPLDRAFPLAPPECTAAEGEDVEAARRRWIERGLDEKRLRETQLACFFGYLGGRYELQTVIAAAELLQRRGADWTFVLCGDGQNLPRYRRLARGLPNVLLPGWVDLADIRSMMRLASVGLAPYISSTSFRMSIPNKIIEYLCGSLPVVSSLEGLVAEMLAENDCGVTYRLGRPERLAGILAELADRPERLEGMSANARRLYEERFSAEKVYGEMVRHLERIASERRGGRGEATGGRHVTAGPAGGPTGDAAPSGPFPAGGRAGLIAKRVFDVVASLLGLAVLWPVLLAVAIWVKLDSKGPVFYRGERVGLGGRRFRMFKFRTMVLGAERMGGTTTGRDDPRLTRAGRVIRKYKLDELPQLFNVVLGDMSLVGPR